MFVTPRASGAAEVVLRYKVGTTAGDPMAHAGITVSSVVSVQTDEVIGNRNAPAELVIPAYIRYPTAPVDAAGEAKLTV